MARLVFMTMALALGLLAGPAFAQFEGSLAFTVTGCQQTGQCVLKNKLRFTDKHNVVWQADAGDKTDGASIPSWAQPFIGQPFDESYLKAAILHDHYCVRQVWPWRKTHRMFYDGLNILGVEAFKAKIMYYAVLIGGPKWYELMKPQNCATKPGQVCIKNTALKVVEVVSRPPQYDDLNMQDELAAFRDALEKKPDMELLEIEQAASQRFPGDKFFNTGDFVVQDPQAVTK